MGTVFVDNLEPQSGTTLTLGASGDTVNLGSGGTVYNTPAFQAFLSSNQSISANTQTTIACDSVIYNSGDYNTSTYRFQPSVLGKYFLYGHIKITVGTIDGASDALDGYIVKYDDSAASTIELSHITNGDYSNDARASINLSVTIDHTDTNDYYYLRGHQDGGSGRELGGNSNGSLCYFGGYRLIGA